MTSWELQSISSPPGEAHFSDGKKFDGLLPMECRCVPGASENEKSRVQTHTAAGRRGLRTMQASSHGILLAWLTLSLFIPHERKEQAGQEKCLKFPREPQEFIC